MSAPAFASNGMVGSFGASLRDGAEDVDLEGNEQRTLVRQDVNSLSFEAPVEDEAGAESKGKRSTRGNFNHPNLIANSSGIEDTERGH